MSNTSNAPEEEQTSSVTKMTDNRWNEANCKGMDTDIFFPPRLEDTTQAFAVCDSCPIRQFCHDWAVENQMVGIWGGSAFVIDHGEWRERKRWNYVPRASVSEISERREQVRELASLNLTNKDIASRLGVSLRTVEGDRSFDRIERKSA